jgi:toxin YoeB
MRNLEFDKKGWNDFGQWLLNDRKIAKKIFDLIEESLKSPFDGKGKPEPLKQNLQGYWSRRIDLEHRLIYKVEESKIIIVSCKGHY